MNSSAPKPTPVPRPTPSKPIPTPLPEETSPKPKAGPKREFVRKPHLTHRPFRELKSLLPSESGVKRNAKGAK